MSNSDGTVASFLVPVANTVQLIPVTNLCVTLFETRFLFVLVATAGLNNEHVQFVPITDAKKLARMPSLLVKA